MLAYETTFIARSWASRSAAGSRTGHAARSARPRPGQEGGAPTGPSPADRSNRGTENHLLVDPIGQPLDVVISGAGRHDSTLVGALLGSMTAMRVSERGRPRR